VRKNPNRHFADNVIFARSLLVTISRRLLLSVIPLVVLAGAKAEADTASSWDGTWTGLMGRLNPAPISVTIAQNKVVSYTVRGAPFDIQYSRITPATVSFGDRDHYSVRLTRTGDKSASARAHGRIGYGFTSLTKQ
jgi:hypothetical protein